MKDIKNRVEKLDKVELEGEIEELSKQLYDPDTADELTEKIAELEKKTEEISTKKENLRQLLDDLKSQGYSVLELENSFEGRLDGIIKKFE